MERRPEPLLPGALRGFAATPARVFTGRAGTALPTAVRLALRADHAAARDAVLDGFDLARDLDPAFAAAWRLFEVATEAATKEEFLTRPDLGRRLGAAARDRIAAECPPGAGLQVALGDGLSAAALRVQAPPLVPLLAAGAAARGWTFGRPFCVRHCRVGVLNAIGETLAPRVVVLLIGERPGLATAESLSAYLAFRPREGHTDADRNLVSNIHPRGVDSATAARRILALAEAMAAAGRSGVGIREGAGIAGDSGPFGNPVLPR